IHPAVGAWRSHSCPVCDLPAPRLHLARTEVDLFTTTGGNDMNKFLIASAIAGCGGNPTGKGETIGTVGGAAAGGAIGHAATGSTAGTVGGAVVGGVIGNEVGERYDDKHRK